MDQQEAHITSLIEADHKQLRLAIGALAQEMDEEVAPEAFSGWKLDFLWQLRDFQNQLLKHFDLEEENGFLGDVLRQAPRFRHIVDQLEEEHQKIIADVNHIISVLKSIEGSASSKLPRVRERIRALIALFEAHESAENDLIQHIYYQDYGVGD
jgi:iron-sulfur cluster repair protein YtfE (RIC family)